MNVVTDLLGKRVTVRRRSSELRARGSRFPDPGSHLDDWMPVVTGIVRGVASANPAQFALLVHNEVVHAGTRRVGALSVFVLSAGPPSDIEVVPEP